MMTVENTMAGKFAGGTMVPRRLRQAVKALIDGNYAYMDSPLFKRMSVERELFEMDPEPELPPISWYHPTGAGAADANGMTPQLFMKPDEERLMFLRFNYAKLRLSRLQKEIRLSDLTREKATAFLEWHRRLEHVQEYLVRTNLALVLAMAKRWCLGEMDFSDVVSEGNMALLRAMDKFSVDRGFKFSTYACRAIIKAFSRVALKASKHRARYPAEFDADLVKSDWADRRRDEIKDDCTEELKAIVDRNLAALSSVEQAVIHHRFNWEQAAESPLTLQEVGEIIGVTKERVRQIQNNAMDKIRDFMEDGILRIHPRVPDELAASAAYI